MIKSKIMQKILPIIILIILNFSCSSKKSYSLKNSLFQCMSKHSDETGIEFYKELENFKKDLLDANMIIDKSKDSYVKALRQINRHDKKWKAFYNKNQKRSYFSSINENFNFFILACTYQPITQKGFDSIEPSLLNIQKFNLYKLSYKPVNDTDILDNLFLASNVNNKIDNLNLMFIILLNLDANFNPDTFYKYKRYN